MGVIPRVFGTMNGHQLLPRYGGYSTLESSIDFGLWVASPLWGLFLQPVFDALTKALLLPRYGGYSLYYEYFSCYELVASPLWGLFYIVCRIGFTISRCFPVMGVILTRAGLFFLFEKLLPRYGGYS